MRYTRYNPLQPAVICYIFGKPPERNHCNHDSHKNINKISFILPAHIYPSTITIGTKKNGVFQKKKKKIIYIHLTIIARARMGSESIAHEAEGRIGY